MNDDFTKRVNKVVTEIKNLKTNQIIGGDSWVVYRAEVIIGQAWNREYLIRFSPEVNLPYVARCYETSPDRVIYGSTSELYPDPNNQGIWWVPSTSVSATGTMIDTTFFVYSTVKGSVSVTDVTGQGLGG